MIVPVFKRRRRSLLIKNNKPMKSYDFKPIKPRSVSEQIFEQLRDLIFRGNLKPGDKLPTERELAAVFEVSRPSVKAAIGKLVNMGIVVQRQGQGTTVRSTESQYLENPLREVLEGEEVSIFDLLEVRAGLEVNAVGLAAARATLEDIQILENCLQDMLSKVDKGQMGSEEDVAFHMCIAFATKNSAQVYLMKNFYDLLFQGIRKSRIYLYEAGNLSTINQQHSEILQAIRNRDSSKAQESMEKHIRFVMETCKNSICDH
jgi:GntR family transcriptional regulator, transcriptional repressor for pyruvate dehydrogenase complex